MSKAYPIFLKKFMVNFSKQNDIKPSFHHKWPQSSYVIQVINTFVNPASLTHFKAMLLV